MNPIKNPDLHGKPGLISEKICPYLALEGFFGKKLKRQVSWLKASNLVVTPSRPSNRIVAY